MAYTAKNYKPDADTTVIGGKLVIEAGAEVEGLPLPTATDSSVGCVKAAAKGSGDTVPAKIGADGKLYVPTYPTVPVATNQAASAAEDVAGVVADLNALLTKLKAAGLMAADA